LTGFAATKTQDRQNLAQIPGGIAENNNEALALQD
jgi:hypothetical protein